VNDRATNHDLIALIVVAVLVIGGGAGALVSGWKAKKRAQQAMAGHG
jgi:hypothetical protein